MAEQATSENNNKQLNWTTEMKIDVVIMDKEERAKGRGFMKRVKERWDQKYPKYQQASWQKLRDNAVRFKKERELMTLIIVRQREEQLQDQEPQQGQEEEQTDFEGVIVNQVNKKEEQAGNNIKEAEQIELPREELTEEDHDLKAMFITQLENLTHSSLLQTEPRENPPKARFDNQLKENANRVLDIYLKEVDTIPEIRNKVYAMGRAIGFKLGKLVEGDQGDRNKKNANGGNRREWKLQKEIKELHQIVAKTSNELYIRGQQRKVTKKEKGFIKELRVLIEKDTTNYNMRNAREQWLNKLRNKKIKLARCEEKRRRKQDIIMFQRDQK